MVCRDNCTLTTNFEIEFQRRDSQPGFFKNERQNCQWENKFLAKMGHVRNIFYRHVFCISSLYLTYDSDFV